MKYIIHIIPDKDGGYTALCPELPGCMTQGDTLEETIEMIQDAAALWLEVAEEDGDGVPEPTYGKV